MVYSSNGAITIFGFIMAHNPDIKASATVLMGYIKKLSLRSSEAAW
jgi:hypothetical protein